MYHLYEDWAEKGKLEHNKPGTKIANKEPEGYHITDAICRFDTHVKEREQKKVEQYKKLRERGRL